MQDLNVLNNEEITIETITKGDMKGQGTFDVLQRALKEHLLEEYESGRIQGAEYAKVYVGALQTTLNQAIQFALEKDVTNQNIRLMDEQIAGAKAQVDIAQEQLNQLKAQTALIKEQTTTEQLQHQVLEANIAHINKQNILLDAQKANLDKDLEAKDAQIDQVREQTKLIEQQTLNALAEYANIAKQGNRIDTEVTLLEQKQVTEQYQTSDSINGVEAGGIIGAQTKLFNNQSEGYVNDNMQKVAKLMLDPFNVRISNDDLQPSEIQDAKLTGADIGVTMTALRTKAGLL